MFQQVHGDMGARLQYVTCCTVAHRDFFDYCAL